MPQSAVRGPTFATTRAAMPDRARSIPALLVIAFALVGCEGSLHGGAAGPIGTSDQPACLGQVCRELPSPSSRVPRLSHPQYENTVRDLLRLDAPPGITSSYLGDATSTTFDNNGAELQVGEALWGDYQRGAEALASQVSTDPAALDRIADGASSGRAFVTSFGLRAHRRPLSDAEITEYSTLFDAGAAAYPEMRDPFAAGVRVVLEAMLQSPHFLYRLELSSERAGDVIQLTDHELAARLSYALWDTMPDDELFRAAQAGELRTPEGIRAQAERMLRDRKAEDMVASFHRQLLHLDAYLDVTRSTSLFPEWNDGLRTSMLAETQSFVRHVIFVEDEGLARLLTAPYTFVDANLARVYRLPGTYGAELERVDLDPAERAGLLTQIGFLTRNASSTDPDAIHRGVFVNHQILCAPLPPPPMMVPPIPTDDSGMLSMRERIDRHTGPGTCGASCHGTMINPIGFAFEHYDALGRWRDQDRGNPVDASAQYDFQGETIAYEGAVELGAVLAAQSMAHRCYVRHWVEYAFGREVGAVDGALIGRIGQGSLAGELSVRDILIELVMSESFRTRSTTEAE